MKIKQAEMIANIIQVMHPGGLQAFMEAQGAFMYMPSPIDLVILHPCQGLKHEVVEKILEVAPDVEFIQEQNFSNYAEDILQAQETIVQWIDENLSATDVNSAIVRVTPVANIMALETLRQGSKLAIKFEAFLKTLPGHGVSYVIYDGGSYSRVTGCTQPQAAVKPEAPKRDTVLSDDDVLNVKIALGNAETVEDFLNSI